jgi:hypothetical protein
LSGSINRPYLPGRMQRINKGQPGDARGMYGRRGNISFLIERENANFSDVVCEKVHVSCWFDFRAAL